MLNRVILMGRLVADPELKQTPNGISVATSVWLLTATTRARTATNVSAISSTVSHGVRPVNLSPVIFPKAV